MSLSLYNQKRHFNKTAEPKGVTKASKGALKFVIQKHDATNLHYDLRLEMEGVLKSWAVPKGPSLNPADKRLAMAVEDHPFDYRNFEGIIPAGEYGGGTVIVWDEGTYTPIGGEDLSKKEQEKLLLKQLKAGDLKLNFTGHKVNGTFALFQMKGRGENTWLLVKKKDEYATEEDITQQDESVKSGKSLAEIAEENGTTLNHPEVAKSSSGAKKTLKKISPAKTKKSFSKSSIDLEAVAGDSISLLKKTPFPKVFKPMLATLVDEPFDDEGWIYEVKWDGYRAVAYCNGKDVALVSRNGNAFTDKYFPITQALQQLKIKAVFDGEVVAVNEDGLPDFQALQNCENTPTHLQYYIFDIIWLDGNDLTMLPLIERKKILEKLLPGDDAVLKYSDHVAGKGNEFFEIALAKGLEGIMGKKADSTYKIGTRNDDWVKIKVNQRQEVVIAGFTKPRNTRQFFGALLLGVYDGNELKYVGHTGGGFNTQSLEQIHKKLQPLITNESPFKVKPKTNQPATWVKPELVCEIKFSEWTKEGVARHPIFMGLRTDKKPKDVVMEKAASTIKIASAKKKKAAPKKNAVAKEKKQNKVVEKPEKKSAASSSKNSKTATSKIKTSGLQLDLSGEKDQNIIIGGHELTVTNLNKLYWKKEKFCKGDMINYYLKIAPYMLPYMLDRPQSLNRHPNGIASSNFYQKNVEGKVPDWMQTHADYSESTDTTVEYLVCKDEATLIYMANLGCIEMNPWHSRTQSWQFPDWCLIDLDPDDPNTFEQVIEVAHVVKEVLDSIGAPSYPKTSGSTGIHIYIPLGAQYTFYQSKQLAELVVNLVHQQMPDITSVERKPAKRKGKIYLDYLQNRQIQTAAAPYSLRPKPGVPVSTPLDWSEIKKGLTQNTYTAHNILDKLKSEGDPFKPVLGKGIDLQKVLGNVQKLFK